MLTDTMLKTWRTTATKLAKRDVVVKDTTTGGLRSITRAGDKIPDRKRSDRDGMYATMTEAGTISFRFDYAVKGSNIEDNGYRHPYQIARCRSAPMTQLNVGNAWQSGQMEIRGRWQQTLHCSR